MKKILSILLAAVMVAGVFTSCEPKDEPEMGKYFFYAPCLDWTFSKDDVRQQMTSDTRWVEDASMETEEMLYYTDRKTSATLTYSFIAGKLANASLTYISDEKFDQFKQDWQEHYDLNWQEKTLLEQPCLEGYSKEKACVFLMYRTTAANYNLMVVTCSHLPY